MIDNLSFWVKCSVKKTSPSSNSNEFLQKIETSNSPQSLPASVYLITSISRVKESSTIPHMLKRILFN